MSHFAKIATQFVNHKELVETLQELHGEENVKIRGLHDDKELKIRGWGSSTRKVDIAVKGLGRYDLGFNRNKEGCYEIVKEAMFNYDIPSLVESYADRVVRNRLPRGKYRVLEREKGRIKLQQMR
jgi:hypothetical protein